MKARGIDGYVAYHPIDSMEISEYTEYYPGSGEYRITGPVQTEIRINLTIDGELSPLLQGLPGKSLTALGSGMQCRHCGSMWSRGNYYCYNCGGKLEVEPFIEPVDWDIIITSASFNAPSFGLMTMELVGYGRITIDETFPNFRFLPSHTGVIPGYRLCEWCGTVTGKHGNCEACGAHRTPLTELVQMDHECTWCGTKTNNGIVCPACATRIGGVMLREVI